MQKIFFKKSLIIGIIVLINTIMSPFLTADNISQKDVLVSFDIYGKSDIKNCQVMLSSTDALFINDLFEKLQYEMIYNPFTDETKNLKSIFIGFLDEKGLLPDSFSKDEVIELLAPSFIHQLTQNKLITNFLSSPRISSSTGSSFFCSVASGGTGKTTPIVIGPRPHAIVLWKGIEGQEYTMTTVGGINSGKGFIAYGNQNGMAIGFEGIGLTYGTPYGTIYGLTGYAVYASVTADYIEFYPPNNKPEISNPIPSNNQENIPITLKELSFKIQDDDKEFMNYSVTTNPFIGSGSKNKVGNGIYSISVDGLQYSTIYSWTVTVTDGKDITTSTFNFKTAYVAPVITDPYPSDGAINVLVDQSNLIFSISDPQNDLMDYTVETSPNIGSKSETNVSAGRYEVPILNLNYGTVYFWYVNVTDGTNWKKEKFSFTTLPKGILIFYPTDDTYMPERGPDEILGSNSDINFRSFQDGWNYRILIKFDLSQISSNIEIVYAKVYLYYYEWKDNNPAGDVLRLYRVLEDWSEDSTNWNNQPSFSTQFSSQSIVPDSPNNWMTWDVTDDVINFISEDESNFGWLLKDDTYWGGVDIPIGRCYSKENGDLIPYIEIGINT